MFAVRFLFYVAIAASIALQKSRFPTASWIIGVCTMSWHAILILLTYKFPKVFIIMHAPLLTISFNMTLLQTYLQNTPTPNVTLLYCFFLICGLLLNSSWMVTTTAFMINLTTTLILLSVQYHFTDISMISSYIFVTAFLIYALYHCESIVKAEIVRAFQLEKMNEDLKKLLVNLPLPILLIDPDTQTVELANNELFRLMSTAETQSIQDINSRLQEKIFQPFNYIEGLGDKDNQFKQNKQTCLQQRLNLFETLQRPYIDEIFQVETIFDFQNQNFIINQGNANETNLQDNQEEVSGNKYQEIFTIKQQGMCFQNKKLKLILFHRITSFINYEKLKMEKNFYEMITATVSHDMRTPINAITGMINNLEYFVKDFKANKLLQIIKNSSKILLFLVNDILDFFQLKNEKLKIQEEQININTLIPDLIDIFSVVAEEKNINLKYEIQTAICDVLYSDEQRIKQVLINLITNSLKFTIKGEICIQITYDDELQLLNFKVNDTGVGVPKEDEEKLFKLFGKLETSKQLNTKGIGLGLNICKKIVEACGGSIFLDKTYKQGASFCFNIQAFKEKRLASKSSQTSLTQYKKTVIQKDDSIAIDNQELYQSLYMSVNESLIDKANIDLYTQNQGQTVRKLMDHDLSPVSLELSPLNNQQQSQQLLASTISLQNDQANCFCDSNQQSQILIIDDNIFNIITLQAIIEMQFKLKVDKATNGLEGIDKIMQRYEQEKKVNQTRRKYSINQQNSHNFQDFQNISHEKFYNSYKIIFMDCNMPIMDGFEATKAIRKLQFIDQQQTQIIALTANTNDSIKIQCLEAGMDDFLTKPVSAATIKDILYKHKLLT
eukprot:403354549